MRTEMNFVNTYYLYLRMYSLCILRLKGLVLTAYTAIGLTGSTC